jgi:hypothetical protein
VSASDALNVAKPGFTLSPSTFLRQARGRHIDMRPNWKEQPPRSNVPHGTRRLGVYGV